jgi:molybdate transport system regulatory protein
MKLSARNQLAGKVEAVDHGAVTTTVKVRLSGGDLITSSITKEAATELDLQTGSNVTVIIKSTDVIIGTMD